MSYGKRKTYRAKKQIKFEEESNKSFKSWLKKEVTKQESKPKTVVIEEEPPHTCSCCEAHCTCCTHPSGRIVGCHCRCTQTMHV